MKIKQIIEHLAHEAKGSLSYVSERLSPFTMGMGIQLLRLEEECVEVCLPRRWRNLGFHHEFHPAALIALATQASELYWQHHLDPHLTERRLRHVECVFLNSARDSVRAQLVMRDEERERLLFDVRKQGETEAATMVRIFNGEAQVVAEIRLHWWLGQTLALSAGRR